MKVKHSRNLWQWFRTPLVATDLETQLLKQDQTTEKVIQKIDLCTWLGYVLIFCFVSLTLVNPMLRINGLAIAFLAWLMICSWVKLDKKRKIARLGWFTRPLPIKKWGKGIGYALTFITFEMALSLLIVAVNHQSVQSTNTQQILKIIGAQPIYMGYVILVAPLLEELVFRQSIFRGLKRWLSRHVRWSSLVVTAIVTIVVALLFAAVHGDSSSLEYIVVSCYLQWIYWREKDLRLSMITHASINVISLGTMLLL